MIAAIACSKDINERTINEGSGLGYPEKVCDLEAEKGEVHIAVIATRDYTVRTEAGWLTVPESAPAGKEGFQMTYTANTSLPRLAKVVIGIDETHHYDTLTVRQKGTVSPVLSAENNVITVKGSAPGTETVSLETNLQDQELVLKWDNDGNEAWINDVSVKNSKLTFSFKANPGSSIRRGSITVTHTDAFGEVISVPLMISQLSSGDTAGNEYSLQDFCALATEEGTDIEEDITIEGIVVSDKENGNCGDNPQTGVTVIDYEGCLRTIYLEATDGSMGIRIDAKTAADNIFKQGDKVKLGMRGTKIFRAAVIDASVDPVYYYVTGFKGNMALSSEPLGREGLPLKEKYIGGLTDEDIFTYVTIKDCELPVRKGPLTPISEQFTLATGSDKVNKFGILLHDICGGSMYLYTNTTCPYRRDGSRLPEGSGNMSGVVVHELYPRFSYQDNASTDADTWGNIGRYQLRHTCKEDFGMAQTMSESTFSGIIAEWRFIKDKNLERYFATDGDENAYFEYSYVYPDSYTDGRAGKLPIIKYRDYSYLGPAGNSHIGHESGVGVILADGSDWMSPGWSGYNSEYAGAINEKGYGDIPTDAGSAWATNLTVRGGEPMYTMLVFSTEGISSSRMSLQISSMNYFYPSTQSVNGVATYLQGPRFWRVEYSLNGESWTPVARYSLPEVCQTSPITQPWQTAGYKPVNVPLPAYTLLGQPKVYLRIIPDAGLQTGSNVSYLDPSIVYPATGSFPTAWNYIGIRYNTVEPPATPFDGDSGIDPMNPIEYNW